MSSVRDFFLAVVLVMLLLATTIPERAGQIAARAVKAYNAEMAQPPMAPSPPPGVRV
ncbi:MAG: hypothetical protein WC829_04320 [Hyphomicrobium sp.]|jgi:hypothetical protein